jgi:hypothetical protein
MAKVERAEAIVNRHTLHLEKWRAGGCAIDVVGVATSLNGYDVHPGERSGFEARVSRPSTPPRFAEHIIT